MLKAFILAILLCIPTSASAIDILIAFTPSGYTAAVAATGEEGTALGSLIISRINKTYESNSLGTPFALVGMYTLTSDLSYPASKAMYKELERATQAWSAAIESERERYGADMVVFFWGPNDTTDTTRAGWAQPGADKLAISGNRAAAKFIFSHELGHCFWLLHNKRNQESIMSIINTSNRKGYSRGERFKIKRQLQPKNDINVRESGAYIASGLPYNSCDRLFTTLGNWTFNRNLRRTSTGFENDTESIVKVYWPSYRNKNWRVRELAQGESFVTGTWSSHPIVIVADTDCLGILTTPLVYDTVQVLPIS